ncbi:hypothetical protein RJZ57_006131 [Blastomyces gilchristii]
MSFQQSSSSITAFPTTERGKESPSVESDKVSRAGTTGSQGAVQPSWPKKRAPTPEPATYRKRMCGPARDLVLGEPSKSGKSLVGYIRGSAQVTMGDFLNKVYACELAGPFDVALPRVRPCGLVAIRTFQGPDKRSLMALMYLTDWWVEHSRLSSLNILVFRMGEVKIAGLEECLELPAGLVSQYSKPLEVITMELMQKYKKENGKTGVNNIEHWGCNSHVTEFLSFIESGVSVETLWKR